MRKHHYFLITATIVLIIGTAATLYLAKNKNQDVAINSNLHGSYNLENKDFGYKFDMSDEFFSGYQEEKMGDYTYYYLPTTDSAYAKEGMHYGGVFSITAVSIKDFESQLAKCKNNTAELPSACTYYENPLGKNNFYYFIAMASQDPPQQFYDNDIIDKALLSVKKTFQTYDISAPPKYLTYQNLKDGYELQYPADLSTHNYKFGSINFPFEYSGNLVGQPGLAHVIPVQYCGLSGKCEPTTTNYIVSVDPLNMTENELKKKLGSSLTKSQIGDNTVYTYQQGAEGEGVIYHFILPTIGNPMIMVAHKYIDETVSVNYKKEKDFIPFAQQKKIVTEIIKSINFLTQLNKF